MIYMQAGPLKIIVLESANLEELKKGRPAKTPDETVLICWTPDPVWLADKILESNGENIGKLIDEAATRPEKSRVRPHHEPYIRKDFPT